MRVVLDMYRMVHHADADRISAAGGRVCWTALPRRGTSDGRRPQQFSQPA
jgi:hypothetical protein